MEAEREGLYICMLSIHGLVRGQAPELGRDADTGGQVSYVLELARALARHREVGRVDLLTRLIEDPSVSPDYARPEEALAPGARIVRIGFGPQRYVRKESLWNHLDALVDRCLGHLQRQPRLPDVLHSHYADAGYVATQLSRLLDIPQVHTGHSLGRCKRARLLAAGRKPSALERQFNLERRIEAEEDTLGHVSLVVASTHQEASGQYGNYERADARRISVIAPGVDLSRFSPPSTQPPSPRVRDLLGRFLAEPRKQTVLAISRADERKNLRRLVQAFGAEPALRERANLVLIAGTRQDVRALDAARGKVYTDLLLDIDRDDLWGHVAFPKQHSPADIPHFYRYAARRRGVFVNVALTEPFGLTLLEAAASGLPVISTSDGGPRDILANCRNGLLTDPLDTAAISAALLEALSDPERLRRWSARGLQGVRRHYSWDGHVQHYLKRVKSVLRRSRKQRRRRLARALPHPEQGLPRARGVLMCDIDNTLIGDRAGLERLKAWLAGQAGTVAFGIATGRPLEHSLEVLGRWRAPTPSVLISSVGTEIHYSPRLHPDLGWSNHIGHRWRREAIEQALRGMPGLTVQDPAHQREFKLSYCIDAAGAGGSHPVLARVREALAGHGLHARVVLSHGCFLDVVPVRASKGLAVRYLACKWGLPLRAFLVAGDSGSDVEMLQGDTLGVVVANHSAELERLRGATQVYFARSRHADGVLEGIAHYGFGVPATAFQTPGLAA